MIGSVALALFAGLAIIFGAVALTGDPNVPGAVSLAAAFAQQIGFGIATIAVLLLVWRAWPAFFRVMGAYALASRWPVVLVMLVAMSAGWSTHYELGPPGYPEMGLATRFVLLALFPQLTAWIVYTVLSGGLVGGLAAALSRSPSVERAATTA